jgi:hypothetical protein
MRSQPVLSKVLRATENDNGLTTTTYNGLTAQQQLTEMNDPGVLVTADL